MTTDPESAPSDALEMLDAGDRLLVLGVGVGNGGLSKVRPLRLTTVVEMQALETVFQGVSGLRSSQYAQNRWGFPFIPIPKQRIVGANDLFLAPSNVSNEFILHPIYWIDPELTLPVGEEEQRPEFWCVRMFYLIMAMGLWEPDTLEWRDAAAYKGITNVSKDDIASYREGYTTNLTGLRFTSEDLLVPYEQVVAQTKASINQCLFMEEEDRRQRTTTERIALDEGKRLVGNQRDLSYVPPEWTKRKEALDAIVLKMSNDVDNGNSVAEWVTPMYRAANDIAVFLEKCYRVAVLLTLPTLQATAPSTAAYADLAVRVSVQEQQVRDGAYRTILGKTIDALFQHPDDHVVYKRLDRQVARLWHELWRMLRLAVANYERVIVTQPALPPYASYDEMQVATIGEAPQESEQAVVDLNATGMLGAIETAGNDENPLSGLDRFEM